MAGFSQFSVSARAEIPPERLEKAEPFLKAVAPLDADRLLPHTAPAILFQFADFDQFITHDEAQRSVQPASRRWSSGMKARTNSQIRALPDRADVLHQQIVIGALRPIILKKLGAETH
ncbi:MAG: hypothetical protein DMG70_16210 [Acidobacteria bacterium]|nr:MAG: hypothetical protein DMG70_16210 [Acidobacteriota bacterium]